MFKSCCGSLQSERKPPHGVILRHGVLDDQDCRDILEMPGQKEKDWLTVSRQDPATGQTESVRDERRVTQSVVLEELQTEIDAVVARVWQTWVQPAYQCDIEWFEHSTLLCYGTHGFYGSHFDAEVFVEARNAWQRVRDRDLSMLLYVNDDYQGGYLNFMNFNYRYRPRAGDMLVFPSDHRYLHQAEKVSAGNRYAVVSWAALRGGQRCFDTPPEDAIVFDEPRP